MLKAAVVLISEQVEDTFELRLDGTSLSCEDSTSTALNEPQEGPQAPRQVSETINKMIMLLLAYSSMYCTRNANKSKAKLMAIHFL